MCTDEGRTRHGFDISVKGKIHGRGVLTPLEGRHVLGDFHKPPSPPFSPKLELQKQILKRGNDSNGLRSSVEKNVTPKSAPKLTSSVTKKLKKTTNSVNRLESSLDFPFSLILLTPDTIAAARREEATLKQAERKMKIDHYGRTKAKLNGNFFQIDSSKNSSQEEKRCSFITAYSDPLYVAYHDKEWGVPVHDDAKLFEMLVLSGAQVGSDWTSILKKRDDFRDAFSDFDPEIVSKYTEKKIFAITVDYGIDLTRVRIVVDNSNRILEIRKEFGSFDKYIWGFVNHKPISTQYRSCRKIPAKTSKSESISRDMIRRGFRSVGPTAIHSFMQATGLTNDHLITCPRHHHCSMAPSARKKESDG